MEKRDLFNFHLKPLKMDTYYSWSNDMEAVLRGNGLRKFVERANASSDAETPGTSEQEYASTKGSMSESESQKLDQTLAFLFISIDTT